MSSSNQPAANEVQRNPSSTERSPKWHEVERAHLAKEGWGRNCGATSALQVHHKMPFHLDPVRELDPTNLITLCENFRDGVECHLHVGHLGNCKNFNPQIAQIADSPAPGQVATHLRVVAESAVPMKPEIETAATPQATHTPQTLGEKIQAVFTPTPPQI